MENENEVNETVGEMFNEVADLKKLPRLFKDALYTRFDPDFNRIAFWKLDKKKLNDVKFLGWVGLTDKIQSEINKFDADRETPLADTSLEIE